MTGKQLLARLCSAEFLFQFAAASTAPAIRDVIRGTPEFRLLREKYEGGTITDASLKRWIDVRLQDFRVGQVFQDEIALCVIAVLLENYATDFAEEYLRDLSRLQAPELSLARRVAVVCQRLRGQSTTTRLTRNVRAELAVRIRRLPATHGFAKVEKPADGSQRKVGRYAHA